MMNVQEEHYHCRASGEEFVISLGYGSLYPWSTPLPHPPSEASCYAIICVLSLIESDGWSADRLRVE